MSLWDDFDCEMQPMPLDTNTADRLLAGAVPPEDAPPGYAEVARLLEALTLEATPEDFVREAETVAIVSAAVRSSRDSHSASPRRSFMPFALSRPRMTAALIAAVVACSAGLASAGAFPGAAQDVASAMLAKVGISVPGPNDNAGTHPGERGKSSSTRPAATSDEPAPTAGKGGAISDLARATELEAIDKGAAVSTAASEGKSHAGQHRPGSEGSAQAGSAPVATPHSGGTGTADTASGGKSSHGTSTANTASGGHSSAGSGNASHGQETADSASGGHSGAGSNNGNGGNSKP
jgi:hypothetical protein